ncbi:AAA family ATPase [Gemmiger sp.]|uniref:AAA family ATPase n=1 Tax=Gemmiger sp. TaxID=2049027 RepID=UPI003AF49947
MEENQTVPAMIPEGDFAAFLEGEKVEALLSPLGYAYCAEGQDADIRVKRLERLEVTARQRGATPAQMEDWHMLRNRELDVEWMLNRDSVRSKARWVALQGSPLQTIASVQPREAEYLAEPYLPRGMITILAGHAGQGKTTLALWLASHVSNGDLMPGGKPGNVYYFTTENDESIVLRPRLEAMDARLDRVMVMRSDARQLTLTDPRLFEMHKIFGGKPDLIVFDPVQSYVGKKLDMNRTDDVRFMMDNLNKLLHATNAAVVLICHTKKAPMGFNGRPCELINGSSDFVNAARSVCFLGRDPARPDVCVVAQEKNSLGLPGASLAFTIGEDGAVHWSDEECELTAAQILTYSDEKRRHAARPSERAQAALRDLLAKNEKMRSTDILEACAKQGISRSAVYRARDELPIQKQRTGMGSFWSMPAKSQMDTTTE